LKNIATKEPIVEISQILEDYKLAVASREASIMGRKEVFMGKAKFGIFGDGKEVPQLALAQIFRNGDFRSGYYRDQTLMFSIGELTIQQYFAQLYAHTSVVDEPASGGRLMNGHFATRMLDDDGRLKDVTKSKNSTADISSTAGQMPRLVGLGLASKYFRNNKELHQYKELSQKGNEVAFGTIGNASTSEGMFFEAINAIGVLQVPVIMSVWDDEYGISVPAAYHTTKQSISKALAGMQRTTKEKGFEILTVKAWDYEGLVKTYKKAEKFARDEHVPVIVHVIEATQPQGHSTSGSHERYKSKERLQWEIEHDCNLKMREWIIENEYATEAELESIEVDAKSEAKKAKNDAWKAFINEEKESQAKVVELLTSLSTVDKKVEIEAIKNELSSAINPLKLDSVKAAKKALRLLRGNDLQEKEALLAWLKEFEVKASNDYGSHLYSESDESALSIESVAAEYVTDAEMLDGRQILQSCFDAALERDPRVLAFGEDVGKIGDVNQAFAGLQDKFGINRVDDTGIRETTIIGQGVGLALRGLRPIAEIQYLDYLVYALPTLTDDLASLQYRTKGGQKAPLIIRTRGHRLEGVWHSGSPMGMLLNSLKGIYLLVPRNMTKAAGMYNTMLASDDTALIIESLNGYRLKEKMPSNLPEYQEPLGVPEVLKEGSDVTIITYGSMCRIVMDAAQQLDEIGISCEVIDVQTLMPFDVHHNIIDSVKKTNRVVFADEDVPGGASAFMMQKVLEEQEGYRYLDSSPLTIAAKEHRPAYGSDGDYFSKPNAEELFDKIYALMSEVEPESYPDIYNLY
jgi:2-oxoisovalerate dehydrogenase E1 component